MWWQHLYGTPTCRNEVAKVFFSCKKGTEKRPFNYNAKDIIEEREEKGEGKGSGKREKEGEIGKREKGKNCDLSFSK